MTDPLNEQGKSPAEHQKPDLQPFPAWLAFAVIALMEYLVLSYSFDAQDLLIPAGLQSQLGAIGGVLPLGFVVVVAILITGRQIAQHSLESLAPFARPMAVSVSYGLVHSGLFLSALMLAHKLTTLGTSAVSWARLLFALSGVVLAIAFVVLALSLWSWSTLHRALRPLRGALVVGGAVGTLAWGAGQAAQLVWKPLAWLTLELVHALLTLIASDPVALVSENLVGTSRFYITIAPVCSGVEGIGLMLGFMTAFLYMERAELRWPRSFLLIPLTVSAIWLLNVVRITALVAIGTWGSPEIALGSFHSKAGWVFFTCASLGAIAVARRSTVFRRASQPSAEPSTETATAVASHQDGAAMVSSTDHPDAAYLLPLLAVLGVSLVTGLATSGFDYFYPLRVLVAVTVLWLFRREYPRPELNARWLGLSAGASVAALWIFGFQPVEGAASEQTGEVLASLPPVWAGLWLAFRLIGGVITVPVIEELAFRGYLMRRLSSPEFEKVPFRHTGWLGLIVSSLSFGVLHSQWLLGLVAGAVFGLLAMARNRLSDAIVAHSVANLGLACYVLITGKWSMLG